MGNAGCVCVCMWWRLTDLLMVFQRPPSRFCGDNQNCRFSRKQHRHTVFSWRAGRGSTCPGLRRHTHTHTQDVLQCSKHLTVSQGTFCPSVVCFCLLFSFSTCSLLFCVLTPSIWAVNVKSLSEDAALLRSLYHTQTVDGLMEWVQRVTLML